MFSKKLIERSSRKDTFKKSPENVSFLSSFQNYVEISRENNTKKLTQILLKVFLKPSSCDDEYLYKEWLEEAKVSMG